MYVSLAAACHRDGAAAAFDSESRDLHRFAFWSRSCDTVSIRAQWTLKLGGTAAVAWARAPRARAPTQRLAECGREALAAAQRSWPSGRTAGQGRASAIGQVRSHTPDAKSGWDSSVPNCAQDSRDCENLSQAGAGRVSADGRDI